MKALAMAREFKRKPGILRFLAILAVCLVARTNLSSEQSTAKPNLLEVRTERLSKFIQEFDIADGSDLAAVALSDLRVRVWSLKSGQVVHEFAFPEPESDQRLKLE